MTLLCGGYSDRYYVSKLEEVPYTHRSRAITLPKKLERALEESTWDSVRLHPLCTFQKKRGTAASQLCTVGTMADDDD